MAAMFALTRTPLGPHGQRGARQPRARRVRRLRHAARALAARFVIVGFFAGIAGGLAASTSRSSRPRTWARCAPAACCWSTFIGGVGFFFGPDHRRHACSSASSCAVGLHQGLAALPRPVLPVDGDVRARRHRQPDHDAAAGDRARGAVSELVPPYALAAARGPARARRR